MPRDELLGDGVNWSTSHTPAGGGDCEVSPAASRRTSMDSMVWTIVIGRSSSQQQIPDTDVAKSMMMIIPLPATKTAAYLSCTMLKDEWGKRPVMPPFSHTHYTMLFWSRLFKCLR